MLNRRTSLYADFRKIKTREIGLFAEKRGHYVVHCVERGRAGE